MKSELNSLLPKTTKTWHEKVKQVYAYLTTAPDEESDDESDGTVDSEDDVESEPAAVSIRTLFRYSTEKDKWSLASAVFVSSVLGGGTFAWSYLFVWVVNLFTNYSTIVSDAASSASTIELAKVNFVHQINVTICIFGVLAVVFFVLGYLRVYLWTMVSERTVLVIRRKFYQTVLRQSISWHDENPSGELVTVLTNEIGTIQEGISDLCGQFVQGVATMVIGVLFALYIAFRYSIVLFVFLMFIMVSSTIAYNVAAKILIGMQKSRAKAGNVVHETISAIRTVKAYGGEERAGEAYGKHLNDMKQFGIRRGFLSGLEIGFSSLYFNLIYSFGLYYGLIQMQNGMNGVDILQALLLLVLGAEVLGDQLEIFSDVSAAFVAAGKVFHVIDNVHMEYIPTKRIAHDLKGNIFFNKVSFAYPSRKNTLAVNKVSLHVNNGEMVALVGHSGSGKSTIVSLLTQLYTPDQGTITIDGQNIRDLDYASLRNEIGIVSQEPVLFGATVYENICWGAKIGNNAKDFPTKSRVMEVCQQANIHDAIIALPEGYDTFVGEGGNLFSGGQKQRLAIARCLIRNPKILLLDEATSALDTNSEKIVQKTIEDCIYNSSAKRTCIVIAHRLSTIQRADRIIVMKDGKVIESGTHASLLTKKDGAYSLLVQAQTIGGENAAEASDEEGLVDASSSYGKPLQRDESPIVEDSHEESAATVVQKSSSVLFRVLTHTKPNLMAMCGALFTSVINGAFLPIFAGATATIASIFSKPEITDDDISTVHFWIRMFLIMGIADFIIPLLRRTLYAVVGEHVAGEMRKSTFTNLLKQPIEYFNQSENSTGAIAARMDSESDDIKRVVGGPQMGLLVQAVGGFGIAMICSFFDIWQLSLLAIAMVPMMSIGVFWELHALDQLIDDVKDAHEQSCQLATEFVQNIRTVKFLSREDTFSEIFNKESEKAFECAVNCSRVASYGVGIKEGSEFIAYGATFWYASTFVLNQEYSPEVVIRTLYLVLYSAQAIGWMYYALPAFVHGRAAATSMFDVIDAKNPFAPTPPGAKLSSFKNVKASGMSFAYPSRPNCPVLANLDLSIFKDKMVALVGESGSGKSTFLSLVLRFYDVTQGELSLNNVNVKDYMPDDLRSTMAIVAQEPTLFSGSIFENVAYGKLSDSAVSKAEVVHACKLANIHDTIEQLPLGYNTQVGDRGVQLSGGQKQRLAIARAMIRNPELLLLDEATSALDTESERIVQNALNSAMTDRTTIVVAHRLSTIQQADVIVVFRDGEIHEMGSHSELLKLHGVYQTMVKQQQFS